MYFFFNKALIILTSHSILGKYVEYVWLMLEIQVNKSAFYCVFVLPF